MRPNTPTTTTLKRSATSVCWVCWRSCPCWARLSGRSSRAARRSRSSSCWLAACVLQMFGQAVTDVTWSSGSCLPMFFAVLAAITVFCADSLRLKLPEKNKGGAVRWPVTAVCAVFTVLIGLNLIAQSKLNSDNLTLDDLKLGAKSTCLEQTTTKCPI